MSKFYVLIATMFFSICIVLIIVETHKLFDDIVARNYSCGHITKVSATIIDAGWNGKNELGEDKSCYVSYMKYGRLRTAERWNIGNCDIGRVIQTEFNDYTCPK